MRILDAVRLRLRSLFRGTSVERDLDEELRFHVESHVDELIARGMSRDEARTIALRRFGGVDQVKESVRDTWHVRLLGDVAQDLRYGLRSLRHSPVFTAVAALTLALGIGATTAIFSVVDGVLLKPLTYPTPDRIVRVLTHWPKTGHDGKNLSGADFVDARDRTERLRRVQHGLGRRDRRPRGRSFGAGRHVVRQHVVLRRLRRAARRGPHVPSRRREEGGGGVERLRDAAFRIGVRRALGRTISVDTITYDIVGVMPAGFHFPQLADVWVPVPNQPDNMNRSAHNYPTVARRRADVSPQALGAAMATLSGQLATTYKDTNAEKTLIAMPLQERMVGSMRATLYLLLGAVAILFLIACANVANLLLARASVRTREIALRSALGADRWRILRQLVVESLLLAAIGGALGLLFAYVGTGALIRLAPVSLPRLGEVAVDRGVLALRRADVGRREPDVRPRAGVAGLARRSARTADRGRDSRHGRRRIEQDADGPGRRRDRTRRRARHRRRPVVPQLHGAVDRHARLPHVRRARRSGQPPEH